MSTILIPTPQTKYLSCAETANLVRVQLKKNFPGTKFSVRSSNYAGGASIRVSYESTTVGPKAVREITDQFVGSGFDGMIDMAYNKTHFLNADGTANLAHSPGTENSAGSVPAQYGDAKPGAVAVSFGADHIFVSNDFHPDACSWCVQTKQDWRCNHYWEPLDG